MNIGKCDSLVHHNQIETKPHKTGAKGKQHWNKLYIGDFEIIPILQIHDSAKVLLQIESKVRTFDTSGTLFLPLPKSIKKVSVGRDWREMKTYDPYRHWLYHSGTCSFASSGCVSSVWSSMISWMSFLHRFYHYFWPLRRPHWGSSTQIALRWIKMSASFWLFGLMYTQSTQMLLWNGLRKGKNFLTWLKVYTLEYTVILK